MGRLSPLGLGATIALAVWIIFTAIQVKAAPVQENTTSRFSNATLGRAQGCFFMDKWYPSGEQIETNENCLNCTCVGNTLLCYLRVCPFVKPVGESCVTEQHVGDCCPKFWCPEVYPRSTTESSESPRGCFLDGRYYDEGARIPMDPRKPCEVCYCIRNTSICTMQECELKVSGCYPEYKVGSCCPSRYNCTEDAATTIPPGIMEPEQYEGCFYNDILYQEGDEVPSIDTCQTCYCMKHEVVCAVHNCTRPAENCEPVDTDDGECCPKMYKCPEGTEIPTTTEHMVSSLDMLNMTTVEPVHITTEVMLPSTTLFSLAQRRDLFTTKGTTTKITILDFTTPEQVSDSSPTTQVTARRIEGDEPFDENRTLPPDFLSRHRAPKITEVPDEMFTTAARPNATARPIFRRPIPGEGICRHMNRTFQNGEEVPSSDLCLQCKCTSSVIKCTPVECVFTTPATGTNCKLKKVPGECCRQYVCEETNATTPIVQQEEIASDKFDEQTVDSKLTTAEFKKQITVTPSTLGQEQEEITLAAADIGDTSRDEGAMTTSADEEKISTERDITKFIPSTPTAPTSVKPETVDQKIATTTNDTEATTEGIEITSPTSISVTSESTMHSTKATDITEEVKMTTISSAESESTEATTTTLKPTAFDTSIKTPEPIESKETETVKTATQLDETLETGTSAGTPETPTATTLIPSTATQEHGTDVSVHEETTFETGAAVTTVKTSEVSESEETKAVSNATHSDGTQTSMGTPKSTTITPMTSEPAKEEISTKPPEVEETLKLDTASEPEVETTTKLAVQTESGEEAKVSDIGEISTDSQETTLDLHFVVNDTVSTSPETTVTVKVPTTSESVETVSTEKGTTASVHKEETKPELETTSFEAIRTTEHFPVSIAGATDKTPTDTEEHKVTTLQTDTSFVPDVTTVSGLKFTAEQTSSPTIITTEKESETETVTPQDTTSQKEIEKTDMTSGFDLAEPTKFTMETSTLKISTSAQKDEEDIISTTATITTDKMSVSEAQDATRSEIESTQSEQELASTVESTEKTTTQKEVLVTSEIPKSVPPQEEAETITASIVPEHPTTEESKEMSTKTSTSETEEQESDASETTTATPIIAQTMKAAEFTSTEMVSGETSTVTPKFAVTTETEDLMPEEFKTKETAVPTTKKTHETTVVSSKDTTVSTVQTESATPKTTSEVKETTVIEDVESTSEFTDRLTSDVPRAPEKVPEKTTVEAETTQPVQTISVSETEKPMSTDGKETLEMSTATDSIPTKKAEDTLPTTEKTISPLKSTTTVTEESSSFEADTTHMTKAAESTAAESLIKDSVTTKEPEAVDLETSTSVSRQTLQSITSEKTTVKELEADTEDSSDIVDRSTTIDTTEVSKISEKVKPDDQELSSVDSTKLESETTVLVETTTPKMQLTTPEVETLTLKSDVQETETPEIKTSQPDDITTIKIEQPTFDFTVTEKIRTSTVTISTLETKDASITDGGFITLSQKLPEIPGTIDRFSTQTLDEETQETTKETLTTHTVPDEKALSTERTTLSGFEEKMDITTISETTERKTVKEKETEVITTLATPFDEKESSGTPEKDLEQQTSSTMKDVTTLSGLTTEEKETKPSVETETPKSIFETEDDTSFRLTTKEDFVEKTSLQTSEKTEKVTEEPTFTETPKVKDKQDEIFEVTSEFTEKISSDSTSQIKVEATTSSEAEMTTQTLDAETIEISPASNESQPTTVIVTQKIDFTTKPVVEETIGTSPVSLTQEPSTEGAASVTTVTDKQMTEEVFETALPESSTEGTEKPIKLTVASMVKDGIETATTKQSEISSTQESIHAMDIDTTTSSKPSTTAAEIIETTEGDKLRTTTEATVSEVSSKIQEQSTPSVSITEETESKTVPRELLAETTTAIESLLTTQKAVQTTLSPTQATTDLKTMETDSDFKETADEFGDVTTKTHDIQRTSTSGEILAPVSDASTAAAQTISDKEVTFGVSTTSGTTTEFATDTTHLDDLELSGKKKRPELSTFGPAEASEIPSTTSEILDAEIEGTKLDDSSDTATVSSLDHMSSITTEKSKLTTQTTELKATSLISTMETEQLSDADKTSISEETTLSPEITATIETEKQETFKTEAGFTTKEVRPEITETTSRIESSTMGEIVKMSTTSELPESAAATEIKEVTETAKASTAADATKEIDAELISESEADITEKLGETTIMTDFTETIQKKEVTTITTTSESSVPEEIKRTESFNVTEVPTQVTDAEDVKTKITDIVEVSTDVTKVSEKEEMSTISKDRVTQKSDFEKSSETTKSEEAITTEKITQFSVSPEISESTTVLTKGTPIELFGEAKPTSEVTESKPEQETFSAKFTTKVSIVTDTTASADITSSKTLPSTTGPFEDETNESPKTTSQREIITESSIATTTQKVAEKEADISEKEIITTTHIISTDDTPPSIIVKETSETIIPTVPAAKVTDTSIFTTGTITDTKTPEMFKTSDEDATTMKPPTDVAAGELTTTESSVAERITSELDLAKKTPDDLEVTEMKLKEESTSVKSTTQLPKVTEPDISTDASRSKVPPSITLEAETSKPEEIQTSMITTVTPEVLTESDSVTTTSTDTRKETGSFEQETKTTLQEAITTTKTTEKGIPVGSILTISTTETTDTRSFTTEAIAETKPEELKKFSDEGDSVEKESFADTDVADISTRESTVTQGLTSEPDFAKKTSDDVGLAETTLKQSTEFTKITTITSLDLNKTDVTTAFESTKLPDAITTTESTVDSRTFVPISTASPIKAETSSITISELESETSKVVTEESSELIPTTEFSETTKLDDMDLRVGSEEPKTSSAKTTEIEGDITPETEKSTILEADTLAPKLPTVTEITTTLLEKETSTEIKTPSVSPATIPSQVEPEKFLTTDISRVESSIFSEDKMTTSTLKATEKPITITDATLSEDISGLEKTDTSLTDQQTASDTIQITDKTEAIFETDASTRSPEEISKFDDTTFKTTTKGLTDVFVASETKSTADTQITKLTTHDVDEVTQKITTKAEDIKFDVTTESEQMKDITQSSEDKTEPQDLLVRIQPSTSDSSRSTEETEKPPVFDQEQSSTLKSVTTEREFSTTLGVSEEKSVTSTKPTTLLFEETTEPGISLVTFKDEEVMTTVTSLMKTDVITEKTAPSTVLQDSSTESTEAEISTDKISTRLMETPHSLVRETVPSVILDASTASTTAVTDLKFSDSETTEKSTTSGATSTESVTEKMDLDKETSKSDETLLTDTVESQDSTLRTKVTDSVEIAKTTPTRTTAQEFTETSAPVDLLKSTIVEKSPELTTKKDLEIITEEPDITIKDKISIPTSTPMSVDTTTLQSETLGTESVAETSETLIEGITKKKLATDAISKIETLMPSTASSIEEETKSADHDTQAEEIIKKDESTSITSAAETVTVHTTSAAGVTTELPTEGLESDIKSTSSVDKIDMKLTTTSAKTTTETSEKKTDTSTIIVETESSSSTPITEMEVTRISAADETEFTSVKAATTTDTPPESIKTETIFAPGAEKTERVPITDKTSTEITTSVKESEAVPIRDTTKDEFLVSTATMKEESSPIPDTAKTESTPTSVAQKVETKSTIVELDAEITTVGVKIETEPTTLKSISLAAESETVSTLASAETESVGEESASTISQDLIPKTAATPKSPPTTLTEKTESPESTQTAKDEFESTIISTQASTIKPSVLEAEQVTMPTSVPAKTDIVTDESASTLTQKDLVPKTSTTSKITSEFDVVQTEGTSAELGTTTIKHITTTSDDFISEKISTAFEATKDITESETLIKETSSGDILTSTSSIDAELIVKTTLADVSTTSPVDKLTEETAPERIETVTEKDMPEITEPTFDTTREQETSVGTQTIPPETMHPDLLKKSPEKSEEEEKSIITTDLTANTPVTTATEAIEHMQTRRIGTMVDSTTLQTSPVMADITSTGFFTTSEKNITESTSSPATTTSPDVTQEITTLKDETASTSESTIEEKTSTTPSTIKSSTEVGTTAETMLDDTDDCVLDGTKYEVGQAVITKDPCEKCHCSSEGITCFKVICKVPRSGCKAVILGVDECCSTVFECPTKDGGTERVTMASPSKVTEKDITTPIPISFMFSTTPSSISSTVIVTKSDVLSAETTKTEITQDLKTTLADKEFSITMFSSEAASDVTESSSVVTEFDVTTDKGVSTRVTEPVEDKLMTIMEAESTTEQKKISEVSTKEDEQDFVHSTKLEPQSTSISPDTTESLTSTELTTSAKEMVESKSPTVTTAKEVLGTTVQEVESSTVTEKDMPRAETTLLEKFDATMQPSSTTEEGQAQDTFKTTKEKEDITSTTETFKDKSTTIVTQKEDTTATVSTTSLEMGDEKISTTPSTEIELTTKSAKVKETAMVSESTTTVEVKTDSKTLDQSPSTEKEDIQTEVTSVSPESITQSDVTKAETEVSETQQAEVQKEITPESTSAITEQIETKTEVKVSETTSTTKPTGITSSTTHSETQTGETTTENLTTESAAGKETEDEKVSESTTISESETESKISDQSSTTEKQDIQTKKTTLSPEITTERSETKEETKASETQQAGIETEVTFESTTAIKDQTEAQTEAKISETTSTTTSPSITLSTEHPDKRTEETTGERFTTKSTDLEEVEADKVSKVPTTVESDTEIKLLDQTKTTEREGIQTEVTTLSTSSTTQADVTKAETKVSETQQPEILTDITSESTVGITEQTEASTEILASEITSTIKPPGITFSAGTIEAQSVRTTGEDLTTKSVEGKETEDDRLSKSTIAAELETEPKTLDQSPTTEKTDIETKEATFSLESTTQSDVTKKETEVSETQQAEIKTEATSTTKLQTMESSTEHPTIQTERTTEDFISTKKKDDTLTESVEPRIPLTTERDVSRIETTTSGADLTTEADTQSKMGVTDFASTTEQAITQASSTAHDGAPTTEHLLAQTGFPASETTTEHVDTQTEVKAADVTRTTQHFETEKDLSVSEAETTTVQVETITGVKSEFATTQMQTKATDTTPITERSKTVTHISISGTETTTALDSQTEMKATDITEKIQHAETMAADVTPIAETSETVLKTEATEMIEPHTEQHISDTTFASEPTEAAKEIETSTMIPSTDDSKLSETVPTTLDSLVTTQKSQWLTLDEAEGQTTIGKTISTSVPTVKGDATLTSEASTLTEGASSTTSSSDFTSKEVSTSTDSFKTDFTAQTQKDETEGALDDKKDLDKDTSEPPVFSEIIVQTEKAKTVTSLSQELTTSLKTTESSQTSKGPTETTLSSDIKISKLPDGIRAEDEDLFGPLSEKERMSPITSSVSPFSDATVTEHEVFTEATKERETLPSLSRESTPMPSKETDAEELLEFTPTTAKPIELKKTEETTSEPRTATDQVFKFVSTRFSDILDSSKLTSTDTEVTLTTKIPTTEDVAKITEVTPDALATTTKSPRVKLVTEELTSTVATKIVESSTILPPRESEKTSTEVVTSLITKKETLSSETEERETMKADITSHRTTVEETTSEEQEKITTPFVKPLAETGTTLSAFEKTSSDLTHSTGDVDVTQKELLTSVHEIGKDDRFPITTTKTELESEPTIRVPTSAISLTEQDIAIETTKLDSTESEAPSVHSTAIRDSTTVKPEDLLSTLQTRAETERMGAETAATKVSDDRFETLSTLEIETEKEKLTTIRTAVSQDTDLERTDTTLGEAQITTISKTSVSVTDDLLQTESPEIKTISTEDASPKVTIIDAETTTGIFEVETTTPREITLVTTLSEGEEKTKLDEAMTTDKKALLQTTSSVSIEDEEIVVTTKLPESFTTTKEDELKATRTTTEPSDEIVPKTMPSLTTQEAQAETKEITLSSKPTKSTTVEMTEKQTMEGETAKTTKLPELQAATEPSTKLEAGETTSQKLTTDDIATTFKETTTSVTSKTTDKETGSAGTEASIVTKKSEERQTTDKTQTEDEEIIFTTTGKPTEMSGTTASETSRVSTTKLSATESDTPTMAPTIDVFSIIAKGRPTVTETSKLLAETTPSIKTIVTTESSGFAETTLNLTTLLDEKLAGTPETTNITANETTTRTVESTTEIPRETTISSQTTTFKPIDEMRAEIPKTTVPKFENTSETTVSKLAETSDVQFTSSKTTEKPVTVPLTTTLSTLNQTTEAAQSTLKHTKDSTAVTSETTISKVTGITEDAASVTTHAAIEDISQTTFAPSEPVKAAAPVVTTLKPVEAIETKLPLTSVTVSEKTEAEPTLATKAAEFTRDNVTELLTKAYKGVETTTSYSTTTVPPVMPTTIVEDDFLIDDNTCFFEGGIYQSAQQIPRTDPCEFCFCFRGDIICLQQSCPPPAPDCIHRTIPGYCCPRYDCPVLVMSRNLTQLAHRKGAIVHDIQVQKRIDKRAIRPVIEVKGCQVKGRFYELGSTVSSASGPCLHCVCQEGGVMRCDPLKCKPQAPLMLKMNNDFFRTR